MNNAESKAEQWVRCGLDGAKTPPSAFKCFYSTSECGAFDCGIVLTGAACGNVDVHIYSKPSFWLKPRSVVDLYQRTFNFCFNVLRCKRVTALIRSDNVPAQSLAKRMGFQYEGCMRKASRGADVMIFGMVIEDYHCHRWCNVNQRTSPSDSK